MIPRLTVATARQVVPPCSGMPSDASYRPPLGVAPSVAMDAPRILRRGLSSGAIGHGTQGRRYRLLVPMERGGMGELFLTLVTEPGKADSHVVIKRLLADLIDDPKYVEMFESEARVMRSLNHPNIVAVYDMPVIDQASCLAMELVRGKSVQQILAQCETQGESVPPTVALGIMAGILRGLEHAHTFRLPDGTPLNLVHRDVSPGNVLVSFGGDVKLTDFGIAKSQMSVVSTTVGIVKGKARYLAPEQILGEAATPKSDIFSAAAVTCELLTGEPTFDCSSVPKTLYAIVNGQRINLNEHLDFRAPMLVQLLDRALATDPKERVQSAAELAAGLEAQIRLLGKKGKQVEIGPWLSELFCDQDDPLAQFISPPPRAHEEAATEHGYRPDSPLPSEQGQTVQEAILHPDALRETAPAPETEVLDRPRQIQGPGPVKAFQATVGGGETEPPDPKPRNRARTVVEAELVDPPPVVKPVDDTTQVVRRRTWPIEPLPADSEAVSDALSMVAYLQERNATRAPPLDRNATKTLPAVQMPDEPAPQLKPQGAVRGLFLVLGLGLGVAGTLLTQVVLLSPAPKPPKPVAAPARAPTPVVTLADEPPEASEPARAEVETAPPLEVPTPATLSVLYPKGARVWLDGAQMQGRVPMVDIQVAAGRHELKVQKRRYRRKVAFEAAQGQRFEMKKRLSHSEPEDPDSP